MEEYRVREEHTNMMYENRVKSLTAELEQVRSQLGDFKDQHSRLEACDVLMMLFTNIDSKVGIGR